MLSVIIDAGEAPRGLALLLAQLTAGAVDGLVREVFIAGPVEPALLDALCDETGAEPAATVAAAVGRAKSQMLLVLPAELRLRDGWIRQIGDHLARGGTGGVVVGLGGGLLRPGPLGVLVERGRAASVGGADLQRLRRALGLRPQRLG